MNVIMCPFMKTHLSGFWKMHSPVELSSRHMTWCPWILLSHRLAFYEAPQQRSFSTLVLTTQHEKVDHPPSCCVTFVSTGKRARKPKWVSRNLSSYWLRGENFIRHYTNFPRESFLALVVKEAWHKLSKVGNWGKEAQKDFHHYILETFFWICIYYRSPVLLSKVCLGKSFSSFFVILSISVSTEKLLSFRPSKATKLLFEWTSPPWTIWPLWMSGEMCACVYR